MGLRRISRPLFASLLIWVVLASSISLGASLSPRTQPTVPQEESYSTTGLPNTPAVSLDHSQDSTNPATSPATSSDYSAVIQNISLAGAGILSRMAYDGADHYLFVANDGGYAGGSSPGSCPNQQMTVSLVSIVDTTTGNVVGTICVNGYGVVHPEGVAYDPVYDNVYVVDQSGSGRVFVISGLSWAVLTVLSVSSSSWGAVYNPAKQEVYITQNGNNPVNVIPATQHPSQVNQMSLPPPNGGNQCGSPAGGAYDSNNQYMYLPNQCPAPRLVMVVNAAQDSLVTAIPLTCNGCSPADTPVAAVYDPNNQHVYVTTTSGIFEIDATSNTVKGIVSGSSAFGYGESSAVFVPSNIPSKGRIYFGTANQLVVLNDTTDTITETIPMANAPAGVSYDWQNTLLYSAVQLFTGGNVTVVATQPPNFALTSVSPPSTLTIGSPAQLIVGVENTGARQSRPATTR